MSDRDLNRAVARATGEFVETIQRLGFRLANEPGPTDDPPLVLDWDDQEPAYLYDVLSEDDWGGRRASLPSWDDDEEETDDEFEEEFACAA